MTGLMWFDPDDLNTVYQQSIRHEANQVMLLCMSSVLFYFEGSVVAEPPSYIFAFSVVQLLAAVAQLRAATCGWQSARTAPALPGRHVGHPSTQTRPCCGGSA